MEQTPELPTDTVRRIESFVADWLADDDVPGASVAIVDRDDLVYAEGFGSRDLESNAPATADTLYGIGSCTKSFTALAIAQLHEAGRLDLADPVASYVPHLADVDGEPIMVRELLTHTSGMPSDGSAVALIDRLVGPEPMTVPLGSEADFQRYVEGSAGERATDREDFFYYNSGYTLLGRIVEAVDGRSFATYVDEEILTPLGMERATFDPEAFEADEDAMTPYLQEDDGPSPASFPADPIKYPAGGLVASVTELANYLLMNTSGGRLGGRELLDADLLSEMHGRHATRQVSLDGTSRDYGYGWMVSEFLGDTLVGHGGSIGIGTAYVGFLEGAGLGVAVACNTAPATHPMFVGPALLAMLQGEESNAVNHFALREKLDAVEGTYESYREIMTAEVEHDDGVLAVTIGSNLETREFTAVPETLDPDDQTYYFVAESGARVPVEFDLVGDGVDMYVQRWRLHRE
jgi:CubicO group peptidase (beta-lactamase class C family)